MNSFLKNIKNIEILLIILIYLVFFSIALLSFKDFGISVDEWELRVHGFVSLKYIWLTLFNSVPVKLEQIMEIPELSAYYGTHGVYFSVLISFIEYISKSKHLAPCWITLVRAHGATKSFLKSQQSGDNKK